MWFRILLSQRNMFRFETQNPEMKKQEIPARMSPVKNLCTMTSYGGIIRIRL